MQVLPQNVATAGFLLTWEPFDWGRRHNKVLEASKTIEQARNGIQEDRIADRGRSWRKIPQMAGSHFPTCGLSDRSRSSRGTTPGD